MLLAKEGKLPDPSKKSLDDEEVSFRSKGEDGQGGGGGDEEVLGGDQEVLVWLLRINLEVSPGDGEGAPAMVLPDAPGDVLSHLASSFDALLDCIRPTSAAEAQRKYVPPPLCCVGFTRRPSLLC